MTAAKEWATSVPPEDRRGLIRQLAWLAEKATHGWPRSGPMCKQNQARRAAAIRAATAVLEEAGREGGHDGQ